MTCAPQEKAASSLAYQAQAVPGVAAAAALLMAHQRQWIFTDFGGLRMKSDRNGKTLQEWIVVSLADLVSHHSELRASIQPHIRSTIVSASLDAGFNKNEAAGPSAGSHGRFDHYSNFKRQLNTVLPHQALALLRGDKEGALKLSYEIDVAYISDRIRGWFWRGYGGRWETSGLCMIAHDVVAEGCLPHQQSALPRVTLAFQHATIVPSAWSYRG